MTFCEETLEKLARDDMVDCGCLGFSPSDAGVWWWGMASFLNVILMCFLTKVIRIRVIITIPLIKDVIEIQS